MSQKPPPLPSVKRIVDEVLARVRRIKSNRWRMYGFVSVALLFPVLVLLFGMHWFGALILCVVGVVITGMIAGHGVPPTQDVLDDIEADNPEMKYLLSTAHQQEEKNRSGGEVSFLERKVVVDAIDVAISQQVAANHSVAKLSATRRGTAFAAVFFGLSVAVTLLNIGSNPGLAEAGKSNEKYVEEKDLGLIVKPGDTEVEKESRLVVMVEFTRDLPESATLVMESTDGNYLKRIPMKQKLEDPEFGATIDEVPGDAVYRIELDEGVVSKDYSISTFELPKLVQSDANIIPPGGSDRDRTRTEDTQRARIYQGDKVEWSLQFNKPIQEAKLVAKDGSEIALNQDPNDPNKLLAETTPRKSDRYELFLTDEQGRENRNPQFLSVLVKENQRTMVKLNFPEIDARVTPIQEITPQATFIDDLGIKAAGATYRFEGKVEEVAFKLPTSDQPKKEKFSLPFDFETLNAKPNTLLTYFFWAEDEGPDAKVRRTESDMYFIEVRHFEEIYREGPGNAKFQKNPCDCKKLLQLEKQVINATWKKQRGNPEDKDLAADGLALWKMQEYIIELLDGI